MFRTCVLALLCLVVKQASPFSWDILVGQARTLYFYSNNTLTYTQDIPYSNQITSVTYDSVHNRILFSDVDYPNMTISSYDITSKTTKSLLTKKIDGFNVRVVYDPVTQLLVWSDASNIYKFSLNPISANKTVNGKNIVTLDHHCRDVAVDSCGGYIYWMTDYNIERARFDGSEREVLISKKAFFRFSLVIDQLTQQLYWIEKTNPSQIFIKTANFYGKNQTTLYNYLEITTVANSLAVSKDFIYWQQYDMVGIFQLPKNSSRQFAKRLHSNTRLMNMDYHLLVAKYTIQEQIQGIKSCEALQELIANNSKTESTGSICLNYCLEGNCSVSAEGQPECSCQAGYSGKRCEVNACHQYCLHNGTCSLNEEEEPTCECTADYEGDRCDVPITRAGEEADGSTQQVLRDLRSAVRQVLREELKSILKLFSDKLDEDEASVH